MNKRILAAFTAVAVAASTLTFMSFADDRPDKIDSVPVQKGTFETSDLGLFTNRALGVANDFHLFAFDTIDLQAHCNGNFGAPIVNAKSQASGTSSGSLGSGAGGETSKEDEPFGTYPYNFRKEVSLATDTLTLDADCKVDYLFFPENTKLYGPDKLPITDSQKVEVADDGTISGEDPRIKVGTSGSEHKFEAKIGYIYSDYLDFKGKYLDFYKTMSYNLSEITEENADVNILSLAIKEGDDKTASITLQDGINVLNITAKELNDCEHAFNIENVQGEKETYSVGNDKIEGVKYKGTQTLIINLDMESNDAITLNSKVNVKRYDGTNPLSDVSNKEANALEGTIILWNIYNSNADNKMYSGTLNINDSEYGSILAPEADINAQGGMNGNVIAHKIETHAESHRCDFIGALPSFISTTPDPDDDDSSDENNDSSSQGGEVGDSGDDNSSDSDVGDSGDDNSSDSDVGGSGDDNSSDSDVGGSGDDNSSDSDVGGSGDDNSSDSDVGGSGDDNSSDNDVGGSGDDNSSDSDVGGSGDDNSSDSDVGGSGDDNSSDSDVGGSGDDNDGSSDNGGVGGDGAENSKIDSDTSSDNNGVANGGGNNSQNNGIDGGSAGNKKNPITGEAVPAALAVALIGSAMVITAVKHKKDDDGE